MKKKMNVFENTLINCMGAKKEESVLVVTDTLKQGIGKSFLKAAKNIGCKSSIIIMQPLKHNGQEPKASVAKAMLNADIIMLPTTKSMSHTIARKNACENGARLASMPKITNAMIKRTLSADFSKIRARCDKLTAELKNKKTIRVATNQGTDITFSIIKRKIHGTHEGDYTKKGSWGNLPAGEVCVSPVEKKTNGIFVVNASNPLSLRKIIKPIKIEVCNGYAVSITNGASAERLSKYLASLKNPEVYNIAELGIGCNDKAKLIGNTLEDEKVLGTAHIALGDNFSLGGKIIAPSHVDCVFKKPTIWADKKMIIDEGRFLF